METSKRFKLTNWLETNPLRGEIIIKSYQRWYLWPLVLCFKLLFGALHNAVVARQNNVPISDVADSVGTIKVKIAECITSIIDGQQRLITLLLLNKALADVAYMFSTEDIHDHIMMRICKNYSSNKPRKPIVTSEKELDQEDLEIVFNWIPSSDVFSLKDSEIVNQIGTIDEDSQILKNYLFFVRSIMDVLKNGYEGERFTIYDIFDAIDNILFLVDKGSDYISETESFIVCNTDREVVEDYNLLVSKLAGRIGTDRIGSYVNTIENSRLFRINGKNFLKILSLHVLRKNSNRMSSEEIIKCIDNVCKKSAQHKVSCTCFDNTYENVCSLVFSLYGNAYVAMLKEDDSFIPYEMMRRLRNMKDLSKKLWQIVAMGAVKLLEKNKVEKFSDLDHDSLNTINEMFDLFCVYCSTRYFTNIKNVSLPKYFNSFFSIHSFADAGITQTFADFLNQGISDEGKMPNDIHIVASQMMVYKTKQYDAPYRVILEYMDRFINSNSNLDYRKYRTVEHIAPLSTKKTEYYDLSKRERQCFANLTLLSGAENTHADDNKVSYKSELVYDTHPLAIVNWKNLRTDINISKRVAPNYFDDMNMDVLRKRAEALAEVLLLMKEKYFGE